MDAFSINSDDGAVWFPGGEGKFVFSDTSVRARNVYIHTDVIVPDGDRSIYDRFMMALHAAEAANQADAKSVTLIMPYYPGARQDKRKDHAREGISAGLFARFLEAAGVSRVVTLEIHNEAIAGMFNPGRCRLENLYFEKLLVDHVKFKPDVVAAPDVGGLERARRVAKVFGSGLVALSKERDYSQVATVKSVTVIGDVQDRSVLLVDDMIDSGGSICTAARELYAAGASVVQVATAHPIMSGSAWRKFGDLVSDYPHTRLYGTTSIRWGENSSRPYYTEISIQDLLSEIVFRLEYGQSLRGVQ